MSDKNPVSDKNSVSDKPSVSGKSPTPRKSLIETGSILASPSGSILENVIGRDREKNGRAAPSQREEEATPQAEADSAPPPETGFQSVEIEPAGSNDLLTDLSTQVSKSVSKNLLKGASKDLSTPASKRVSKPSLTPSSTQGSQPNAGAEASGGQSARRRLLDHAEKEAVTRLSIDVPQSMYGRIKQYVAVHNVESIRALTLALYADFLEEEGF